MSAICGYVAWDDGALPGDPLARMMAVLQPHGPDGSGNWRGKGVALGQQMMHVTPESLNETLPLSGADGNLALTADARLDNREELLSALGLRQSGGLADSQIVLAAFEKWGTTCVERLVGEFAIAIWETRANQLHCITDAMGIRPLFYTITPGRYFAFASEIAALLAVFERPPPADPRQLALLGLSAYSLYIQPEATMFGAIRRISAATVLSVSRDRLEKSAYWRPNAELRKEFASDDECREAFQEIFREAVASRLRSHFPAAALLSGGLDSSSITRMAGHLEGRRDRRLVCISSVPMPSAQGRVVDELEYIDAFRDDQNVQLNFVDANGRGPFDDADRIVAGGALHSCTYQHFLYTAFVREARAHDARVILDGHGGELTASCVVQGYFAELFLQGRWGTLVRNLRCSDPEGRLRWSSIRSKIFRPLVPFPLLRVMNRHRRFHRLFEYPVRRSFVEDVLGKEKEEILAEVYRLGAEGPDHRQNMVSALQRQQRDARLRSHAGFIDHQDAVFSYPYLDRRVIDFCLAVDGRYKYREGKARRLLRLGMEGLLPPKIVTRTSKAPLSPDYHLRFEQGRNAALTRLLEFSSVSELNDVVEFERVLAALRKTPPYQSGDPMRADYASQFLVPWALYLCYFLERFGVGNRRPEITS